jgi:hypothetical protein
VIAVGIFNDSENRKKKRQKLARNGATEKKNLPKWKFGIEISRKVIGLRSVRDLILLE